jgi:hypothetical protein
MTKCIEFSNTFTHVQIQGVFCVCGGEATCHDSQEEHHGKPHPRDGEDDFPRVNALPIQLEGQKHQEDEE